MYPARFDYLAATSLNEAIEAKAADGDEARVLAGGQSLLPLMKLRFATPARLIDINRIPDLDRIERHNGHLHIGALVRHADIVDSHEIFGAMESAAPMIADPLIRNLGTLCGSVAHCDPEGDWNAVLLATGADVVALGPSGERTISIGEFVEGVFTNTLAPDEMVVAVNVPVPSGRSGGTYMKLKRKIGDYATVGVAVHLELGDDDTITDVGLALTSVTPINTKVGAAEDLLRGSVPSDELFAEAADLVAAACEPRDDVRGTAEWKRHVAHVYTRRGLALALEQARTGKAADDQPTELTQTDRGAATDTDRDTDPR
ncbi:MAG: FAD binding domain-containing protein [Ilumatobacteraceae bacterium]